MRYWKTAGGLAVGILLGASAVAVGVDPSTTRYTACLGKEGNLSKVAIGSAPKHACSKTETQISWNQLGPQGDRGPTGETGARGATGPAGADGTGLKGDQGDQGLQGIQGARGDTGTQGPRGDTGATGSAGADGTAVLHGTTAPGAASGNIGDFYIDTTSHLLYGPKTSGGWGAGVSLVGPTGVTGATGATGTAGTTGSANLAALQGTPCTVNGVTSSLSVVVNAASGAVTLTCTPPPPPVTHTVRAAISSGLIDTVEIWNNADSSQPLKRCTSVTSGCSVSVLEGTDVRVDLIHRYSFSFTCPAGTSQAATLDSGLYHGSCDDPNLDGDYTITAQGAWPPGPFSVTVSVTSAALVLDYVHVYNTALTPSADLVACPGLGQGTSCTATGIAGGTPIQVYIQHRDYFAYSCAGEPTRVSEAFAIGATLGTCNLGPLTANATITVFSAP